MDEIVQVNLGLGAVQLDTSIQCRASVDTIIVGEYAEQMAAGDVFPSIDVYGTKSECWIGDGWHRVLAALQCGSESIAANLHPGGRVDALKHALSANALHGHRRTNADKRRCVEIALREFPKLSSRAVAKMCGVSPDFTARLRPEVSSDDTCTGQDGKQYPASREPAEPEPNTPEVHVPTPKLGAPQDGMQFARMAIMDLEQIREDDVERDAAFERVLAWIAEHWQRGR